MEQGRGWQAGQKAGMKGEHVGQGAKGLPGVPSQPSPHRNLGSTPAPESATLE